MPERFSVEVINTRRLSRVFGRYCAFNDGISDSPRASWCRVSRLGIEFFWGILKELSRTGLSDEPDTRFSDPGPPML